MEGIAKVGKLTPEGSLIWCGWSVGYPVAYESGRTPVADGGIGGNGQAVVANAIPFATDDFRLAANWIQFYANRGEQGLIDFWARSGGPAKKFDTLIEALAAGPSKAGQIIATAGLQEPPAGSRSWESFLFPQSNRRIFLFLEFSLLRSFDGWYRPGTWRPGHLRNDVAPYLVFQEVNGTDQNISGGGLEADLQIGIATVSSSQVNLSQAFFRNMIYEGTQKYRESGSELDIFFPGRLAVLTLPELTNSVFHKLFVRHQPDRKYFQPLVLYSPIYQIWEVTGDTLGH